jgi:glycine hydroxymethyltransferase
MEEEKIKELVKKHEEYKLSGINLIASENKISSTALEALASDLAGRYDDEWYGGSKYAAEICSRVEELAKKLFNAKYAFVTPLSGNMCDLAAIFSFTKAGDEIAGIPKEYGGYPFGYEKFERKFYPLPMDEYFIAEEKLQEIDRDFPLILIASSTILFPHPLKRIAEKFNGIICYDASHVLGLIAGKKFQEPLKEGCHLMIGSTHKSFPGPQGGIVVTDDKEIADRLAKYLLFDFDEGIGLIDNPHVHRIACLGMVMEEMIEYGREYAEQIVKNAKFLAKCLYELDVPIKYAEKGYTESHQILLDLSSKEAMKFYKKLEENKIFIDCIGRIGVAEATYIGMKEKEMEQIAHMIADVYKGKDVKEKAVKMAMQFYL